MKPEPVDEPEMPCRRQQGEPWKFRGFGFEFERERER